MAILPYAGLGVEEDRVGMNTTHTPPAISAAGFALLGTLARHLDGRRTAPASVRRSVAVLTAAADPGRAERLAPRPAEPAALVLRLATWALRQVDDEAVAAARAALGSPTLDVPADPRTPVAA